MAIAVPVLIGSVSGVTLTSGSPNLSFVTTAPSPKGSAIIALLSLDGTRTPSSVSDGGLNSYTRRGTVASSGSTATDSKADVWCSTTTEAVPSGVTITVVTGGLSDGGGKAFLYSVSGVEPITDAVSNANGNTGEPSGSITTVALSTITFALDTQQSAAAAVFTEDSDYTELFHGDLDVGNTLETNAAYRIRSTAGADTYAPTTGLSVKWANKLFSLAGLENVGTVVQGVGQFQADGPGSVVQGLGQFQPDGPGTVVMSGAADPFLSAGTGSFALTGKTARFLESGGPISDVSDPGAFSLSGQAALFDIVLKAGTGQFKLAGRKIAQPSGFPPPANRKSNLTRLYIV